MAHGVEELLRQAVRDAVASSDVNADVLLWLWKSGGEDRTLLASPALIFRTLEKPGRISGRAGEKRRTLPPSTTIRPSPRATWARPSSVRSRPTG